MIQIMSSNGEISYGVNDYVIDTDNELNEIPSNAEGGSTAYSIESGTTFIKDNMNEWSILNTSNGSNSEIVELPDNILYSYEMDYDEFWDNYNNDNLMDGLYDTSINQAIIPVVINYDTKLSPITVEEKEAVWILGYNSETLLKINENGEIIQQITINPEFNFSGQDSSDITLADDKYLYVSKRFSGVVAIDTENNFEQTFIKTDNDNNDYEWKFRIISSYTDSINFLVTDGGTFAISNINAPAIAYFKQGELKAQLDAPNTLFNSNLITVDYNQNKLYYVYSEMNEQDNTTLLKLGVVNTDGTYLNYTLTNQFTLSNFEGNVENIQMFIKNDILYIQLEYNNILYCFLFDTITNQIIQEEQIFSWKENENIYYYHDSQLFDIYYNDDFAVSRLQYSSNLGDVTVFLKIHYQDELSYIEPLILTTGDKYFYTGGTVQDIFIHHCNKESQYLYKNENDQFCLFSFIDNTITTLQNQPNKIFNDANIYSNLPNQNDFFITSYEPFSNAIGCVHIDGKTGNIIECAIPVETTINSSPRDIILQSNKILYGQYVINPNALKVEYSISSFDGKPSIATINKRNIYLLGDQQLGYYNSNGRLDLSYFIHKNNIILETQLQEK